MQTTSKSLIQIYENLSYSLKLVLFTIILRYSPDLDHLSMCLTSKIELVNIVISTLLMNMFYPPRKYSECDRKDYSYSIQNTKLFLYRPLSGNLHPLIPLSKSVWKHKRCRNKFRRYFCKVLGSGPDRFRMTWSWSESKVTTFK